jgi:arginase
MHDVDRRGLEACLERTLAAIKGAGAKRLWISLDADVLDPFVAPGTGTNVRGGLTYREAHLLAELLYEAIFEEFSIELVGVEVAEVNPVVDKQNETAQVCVEWLSSLFGKRIIQAPKRS